MPEELPAPQLVVLAGGLGTRLGGLTRQVPKAMVPVQGVPFVDHQLRLFAAQGLKEVIFATGHLGSQIAQYVGDGKKWGLEVRYVDEGPRRLGTGGALREVASQKNAQGEWLLRERFLVTYGDSYLPIDYCLIWEFFARSLDPALMVVLKNHNAWDESNACFQWPKVTLYEKRQSQQSPVREKKYIDYGLLGFERELILNRIAPGEVVDLAAICHPLSVEGKLAGFLVHQRFYEMGSRQGLADLEQFLAKKTESGSSNEFFQ